MEPLLELSGSESLNGHGALAKAQAKVIGIGAHKARELQAEHHCLVDYAPEFKEDGATLQWKVTFTKR